MRLIVLKFLRDTPAVLGLAIVLFGLFVALFANQLAPYPDAAFSSDLLMRFKPPSAEHWFGTDNLGRDMLSRLVYGARNTVGIAFATTALAFIFSTLGLVSVRMAGAASLASASLFMLGGIPGGQAEYLRVPFADVGPIKIESNLDDERVLFLSDIFPTGYMAAENCDIEPGDTVAVWGCGPVGQFAIQCAWMLGAERVIAVDRVPERLRMAERYGRAETVDFDEVDVYDRLQELTHGRGPDRCIDAVGCEAHAHGALDAVVDKVKSSVMLATDRAHALREAIRCCRKGGTVSVPGAYIGYPDKLPFGAVMNKGLTIKTGQTHMQRYLRPLLEKIESRAIDPTFVVTHRVPLAEAPAAYETFRDKRDGCIKVVLKP